MSFIVARHGIIGGYGVKMWCSRRSFAIAIGIPFLTVAWRFGRSASGTIFGLWLQRNTYTGEPCVSDPVGTMRGKIFTLLVLWWEMTIYRKVFHCADYQGGAA